MQTKTKKNTENTTANKAIANNVLTPKSFENQHEFIQPKLFINPTASTSTDNNRVPSIIKLRKKLDSILYFKIVTRIL